MAEQSTLDFTQLEGVTPITPEIQTVETQPLPITNQLDFSKLEGVTPVTSQQTSTLDFSKLEGVTSIKETEPQITSTRQYTDAEKIRYGIDKQNTFFGNVYRVAKAGTQAAFDPDRDFKDYIKYNFNQEQKELRQKYGELASGAFEDDTVVQAAAMATMMVDPFYIAAYMTPWGRAATATLKGVSALSGATVGLDTMLNNLATTGEVNLKSVGISAASAAVLGPLTVKAFGAIKTLLPNANNAQIQKIISVVEGKKAKDLGISTTEFKKLQTIAGDKDLLAINKQLQQAGKNWVAPIANETKLFNASEKTLQQQIKNLEKGVKDIEGIPFFKQTKVDTSKELLKTLKKKNKTLADKTKEFNLKQKELWKQTAANEKQLTDLVAKRDYTVLKKLKEQNSLTRNLSEAVISASVRPALGASIGYAFGRLWGGDDANLNNWMITGASLGALNKLIQRSGTVFATGEKNLLENLIYNNATRNAFQKVRELTATTTSTKLKAIGGETEKIGMKLFQELDSPVSKFSASAIADKLKLDYSNRAFALIANTTQNEQAAAIRIARGSKEKATPKIQKLANDIRKYLDDFRKEYTDVGIGLRKEVIKKGKTTTQRIDPIKDYFPRVWNWDRVKDDPEKFKRVLTSIFKSKGNKDPKTAAESFYNSLSTHNEQGFYSKEAVNDLVNSLISKKKVPFNKGLIRNLPLSDHIENERLLTGSYAQVEKVLSQNGYLVDDIPSIFNKLIATSADSIAFAKQFGAKGELLNGYIKRIVTKYQNLAGTTIGITKDNYAQKASQEIKLVMDSVDGFFGRYGQVRQGIVKSGAGILSTISNLNMLDRVTIASLGDLVQPFTNSSNFTSWIKGLSRTAVFPKGETGLAKNLGYAQGKEIQQSLLKTLTPLDDATNAANIMGTVAKTTGEKIKQGFKNPVRSANELGFKIMGLHWLTGFARRYAYNTGAIDAYTSANKLAKFVNSGNSLSSAKGIRLTNNLAKYGINTTDGLRIGKANTFDEAIKLKANKKILNDAGITASNRDALIPQVSNRLLFTQSRDPLVRLMGQFMSWTLAKSAQTNKILQRIENGDTQQLVKLLAGLPVYGGIQSLREISKYGEIQTDLETQTDKWYSEALRLSGISGTATELVLGRLTGPGSREPWYLFAPVFSILKEGGNIPKEIYKGNTDKATEIFMEKIAPLPTWRRWIGKLFPGEEIISPVKQGEISNRLKFNEGDIVDANDGFNNDAVVVEQPFLEEAEAVASKKTLVPMAKPNVKEQVQKLETVKLPETNTTIIKGKEISNIIKNKLEDRGINNSKNIADGITGNIYAENSKFITNQEEFGDINTLKDKQRGYGLFQFTDYKNKQGELVGHRTEYNKYLNINNKEDNAESQIDYVLDNIFNKDSGFDIGAGNKNKLKLIFSQGSASDIAKMFMERYEKPKDKSSLEKRIKFANTLNFNRVEKNIGGIVGKAVAKGLSKSAVKRGDTAISTTVGTYKKINNIFDDNKVKTVHDFGSGLGLGSKEFKNKIVTNHEPFVPLEKIIKAKGKVPNYKTADDVIFKEGFASKDGVVNANVLNVIEDPMERSNVVRQISQLINDKGIAVITTRGSEVTKAAQTSKNAIPFNDGWLFGSGDKKTFQKGYSQKELEEYIKSILGDGFKVEKIPSKYKVSSSGVIIKKIKGDK